jgi:hypothetical protein
MAADINLSKIWLEIAIKRHERHMAGKNLLQALQAISAKN